MVAQRPVPTFTGETLFSNKRTNVIVVALLLLCLGIAASMVLRTPHHELNSEQLDRLNAAAKLESAGLDGFEMAIKYPEGISKMLMFPREMTADEPAGPSHVQLDQAFTSEDMYSLVTNRKSFTPTVDASGVHVTFSSEFANLYHDTRRTVILTNSDASLFGDDGIASVEEMKSFYNDDATALTSLSHLSKDVINGECAIELKLDGNTLITDAADDCSDSIGDKSTDQLVDDVIDAALF